MKWIVLGKRLGITALAAFGMLITGPISAANLAWLDAFAVSTDTSDMNQEVASRQSGPLAPIEYVANTPNVNNDFHHQMFAPATNAAQPLQLAGDASILAPAPVFAAAAMVSPNANFVGPGPGGILGKRVTFDLDVAALVPDQAGGSFVQAGVTLGAATPLVRNDAPGTHFGIRAVEDTFSGNGPFLQFFQGDLLVQNLVSHSAGTGTLSFQVDIDDPVDGDPWDGVGSTVFTVSVNGSQVGDPHAIGSGGVTSNYITLSGDRDFNGNDLATHLYDNFAVYSAPIPEPFSLGLAACAAVCFVGQRRRRG